MLQKCGMMAGDDNVVVSNRVRQEVPGVFRAEFQYYLGAAEIGFVLVAEQLAFGGKTAAEVT